MKKLLFTLILIIFTIKVSGHEFNFKTSQVSIDSVVKIDGMNFFQYLVMNIKYPIEAQSNQTVGIYIGRIRIDSKGNLIEVSTINPISKSIDEVFVKLINEIWRNHKISIYNISDTTDFIIPVKYMLSSGYMQSTLEYFVNYEQKPKYLSEEAKVIGYNSNGTASQTKDMTLINKASKLYKEEKYKKSIKYLNELINRNPYSEDLLYMRANAYKNMNDTINSCRDYQYLKYFLNSAKLKGLTQCD
jgi:tetratricopeptide (TPR) repeat protein